MTILHFEVHFSCDSPTNFNVRIELQILLHHILQGSCIILSILFYCHWWFLTFYSFSSQNKRLPDKQDLLTSMALQWHGFFHDYSRKQDALRSTYRDISFSFTQAFALHRFLSGSPSYRQRCLRLQQQRTVKDETRFKEFEFYPEAQFAPYIDCKTLLVDSWITKIIFLRSWNLQNKELTTAQ